MFKNLKNRINNVKVKIAGLTTATVAATAVLPYKAMAVGVENTAVTGAFTQMKDDAIATMGPIGLAAAGILGILLAWKYGRKIFGMIAR